jgi:phospholipid/cholesterol/gamma-HCH transport system substrate-binding protein
MNKNNVELIVGSFVLLAIVIFFIIVFFISGVYFLRQGYTVKVYFNYTAGLEKGASVKMAGVKVGEINKVYVAYDQETDKPKAIVELWIKENVKIREDVKVHVLGTFALSEQHIEIVSAGESDGRILHDGDILIGVDPIPLEYLVEKGEKITNQLEAVINKVDTILKDDKTQESIQQIIQDTSALFNAFYQLMVVRQGDVNKLLDDIQSSSAHLDSILTKMDKGEGTAGQLLSNDELYNELKDFVREIKLHPWRLLKKDK